MRSMHTPFSLIIFACYSMLMAAQVLAAVPLKPSRGENQVVKFRDCPSCPLMVAVPAGQFDMGSPDSEEGRADDEGPVHRVAIHAFAVSKTEITRGQFAAFVTKSKYRSGVECLTLEEGKVAARAGSWRELIYGQSDNYPIGCISWNDAKAYTAWLSRITGKKYRLPSEAEWEYAARSNTRTARYWGDNPDDACAYANGADQTAQAEIQGASSWTTHACADMDPATICDAANLTVACPVASFTLAPTATPGAPVTGVVTYDPVTFIATFNPSANLAINTPYTATVTASVADLAGNLLVVPAVGGLPKPNPWAFTTGTGLAPGAVSLGTASTFGIMATSAITNTGVSTMINGDVSLEPGTSNGLLPVQVNGTIHINDTVSHQARLDLLAAYNNLKGLAPGTTIPGGTDLGAFGVTPGTLAPGTYTSGSTMLVSTPLTLDAAGNANAVWVFQIGSSLTTNVGGGNISLANGAQAKNVFWVPTSDVTVGVGTTFNGTIVAGRNATGQTNAVINGRILAGAITAGTIALDTNTVNVPLP
jgi:hypothetical protein